MARLGSLNNKVFHEDSHSTRTQNGTSTDSRIYQYRRQRSQRSELSRKETYFVSQGSRAVRKIKKIYIVIKYFLLDCFLSTRVDFKFNKISLSLFLMFTYSYIIFSCYSSLLNFFLNYSKKKRFIHLCLEN
uniref:Uncharacterized protein n=1 Tax=Wuchereria bancrofti TaxID=6293 RepID=A0AAF5Q516_WUCBA